MFQDFKYLLCAQIVFCVINTAFSSNTEWPCKDKANTSIPESNVCDGFVHCINGRDETSWTCRAKLCNEQQYRCAYGACIGAELKCNKQIDCFDRSDETDFLCDPTEKVFEKIQGTCSEEEFQCDTGECIDTLDMCNGFADCKDASDETVNACAHLECSAGSFRCAYGACISIQQVGNQVWDCLDGSDEPVVVGEITDSLKEMEKEKDEAKPVRIYCNIPYDKPNLLILNKTGEMVTVLSSFSKVLQNDIVHFDCLPNFVLIGVDHLKCVNNDWYRQWPHCERNVQFPCKDSEITCDNGDCIDPALICNGVKDCADGSDEILPKCVNRTCTENEFTCKYGACIPKNKQCDKNKDCADGSDETILLCTEDYEECSKILQGSCDSDELVQCRSQECIFNDELCNGIIDCSDGSDESVEMCAHIVCPDGSFTCAYGACVPYTALCNGEVDCADGSDEYAELCAPIMEEKEKYEALHFDDSYAANVGKFDVIKEKEILVQEILSGQISSALITEKNIDSTINIMPEVIGIKSITPIISIDADIRIPNRRCAIPANREALRAADEEKNVTLKVGSQVDANTIVTFSCDDGWYLIGGDSMALCMTTGQWSSAVPKCEKRCPPHWNGISTDTICTYENKTSDCQAYSKPDTSAVVTCAEGYESNSPSQELRCGIDGEWDKTKLKCRPQCVKQSKDKPMIEEANVSIYRISKDNLNQEQLQYQMACRGTIISPKLVLTSAFCFNTNDLDNSIAANDPILYTILPSSMSIGIFGQYEQLNGRHNISQIIIADAPNIEVQTDAPAIVVLVDYFTIIPKQVMPICLEFPLSCSSQKNDRDNTDGFLEGTAILNSEDCFVVVGSMEFIYMDKYQQWLEMKMMLHNYLL
ncbi:PREDICTED: low-density lipoprotein receptor-related protein 2-like [Bactrocera latifrons]|uniref:Low-density lipoprotein receptor-related protein 2 n=2 Tax=Bactrocera latifrons TaxID=174628 RepID=A0A0K8WDH6_BACLA|nr:PREDICTED: low-density lipoprotein receptor-related protein 2-like [Bactrocera latifrons]